MGERARPCGRRGRWARVASLALAATAAAVGGGCTAVPREPAGPAACAAVARPSCGSRDGYVGVAATYGPDVGVQAAVGRVVRRTPAVTWSVEARGTYQFLDNTQFLDVGRDILDPGWAQAQVGAKASLAPEATRHVVLRAGLAYADVRGNLNVVKEAGRYAGAYVGVGFETDLGASFSMGPALDLLLLAHESGSRVEAVPQFSWGLSWTF